MSASDPLITAIRAAGTVAPSPDREAVKEWLLPAVEPARRGRARLTLLMAAALAIMSGSAVAEREFVPPVPERVARLVVQDDAQQVFSAISWSRPPTLAASDAAAGPRVTNITIARQVAPGSSNTPGSSTFHPGRSSSSSGSSWGPNRNDHEGDRDRPRSQDEASGPDESDNHNPGKHKGHDEDHPGRGRD